ncbi:MAG: condensation domain-containing protein, partial [Micromonosporaceae bacterium]
DREARAAAEASQAAGEAMDVAKGRLLRARLLRLTRDHWRLVLVMHHVVCDGWSAAILLRDLGQAYNLAVAGAPLALPAATSSVDHARWQRSRNDPTEHAKRVEYWRKRLADTTFRVELPADRPAPEQPSSPAVFVRRTVPEGLTDAIDSLARRRGCTSFAVWAAALGILVAEQTGVARMALGAPYAAREHPDHESVVAILARVSILEVDAAAHLEFGDLVAQTMHGYAEGIDHFVPLIPLTQALAEDRGDEIPQMMPVSLTYQSSADVDLSMTGVTALVTDVPHDGPRGRTSFIVEPRRGGASYGVLCSGDRYDEVTAAGWLDRLAEILSEGVERPEATVSELTRPRGV